MPSGSESGFRPMITQLEKVGKAIGNTSRIRILKLLEDGELCVCQITEVLQLAPATASKHLSLLRGAGLIRSRRDGKWIYYRLPTNPDPKLAAPALALVGQALDKDPVVLADHEALDDSHDGLVEIESCCGDKPCEPLLRRN